MVLDLVTPPFLTLQSHCYLDIFSPFVTNLLSLQPILNIFSWKETLAYYDQWSIGSRLSQHHQISSSISLAPICDPDPAKLPASSTAFSSEYLLGIQRLSELFRVHTAFPWLPSIKMLILHRYPDSQGFSLVRSYLGVCGDTLKPSNSR